MIKGNYQSERQNDIEQMNGLPMESIRELLDACWAAKRITEMLPKLPKGMKTRHVHVLDAIWHLNHDAPADAPKARVGTVSAFLDVTAPSVTKLVNELTNMDMVAKHSKVDDRRAVALTLTNLGEAVRDRYVRQFHEHLRVAFRDIGKAECDAAVTAITTMRHVMLADTDSEWTRTVASGWAEQIEAMRDHNDEEHDKKHDRTKEE